MNKKQESQEIQVEYRVYPGEYPVAVFDLTKAERPTLDVQFNLTDFVKEYNLDVEKTSWLFYLFDSSNLAGYHLRTAYYSEYDQQTHWRIRSTGGDFSIPRLLVQSLLSRCETTHPMYGTIKTPVISQEFPSRKLRHPSKSRPLREFLEAEDKAKE